MEQSQCPWEKAVPEGQQAPWYTISTLLALLLSDSTDILSMCCLGELKGGASDQDILQVQPYRSNGYCVKKREMEKSYVIFLFQDLQLRRDLFCLPFQHIFFYSLSITSGKIYFVQCICLSPPAHLAVHTQPRPWPPTPKCLFSSYPFSMDYSMAFYFHHVKITPLSHQWALHLLLQLYFFELSTDNTDKQVELLHIVLVDE